MKGHRHYGLFSFAPMIRYFPLIFVAFVSCSKGDLQEPIEYKGPLQEIDHVEFYNSEDEKITLKLTGDLFYEYANGDQEFPKGVYIEMYDEFGKLKNTLRANYARYIKEKQHYVAQGKVELKNVLNNQQLNTEELFWNPKTKKIYTDKFVTIRDQGDVIYGTGLDAMQDLSDYAINDIEGDLEMNE
jgi:LPS export ABC transporter protein LptC